MNIYSKRYYLIFLLVAQCLFGETDIFIFTDFGGGNHKGNQLIGDWQTAIELASEGWKLANHPHIYLYDGATPLDPKSAGSDLAAAFPYLGDHLDEKIKRIVIHVIDPGVGNQSHHPRTLVLRKDGTLFIGPDNGTLSLACPLDSITSIREIDTQKIEELTDIDLKSGGTFHGRDLFAAAGYLLAANKVSIEEIGKSYPKPILKFRLEQTPSLRPIKFQQISTSRWDIKLTKGASEEELFSHAYFLTIVQAPFYGKESSPQLFFIETIDHNPIGIYNRKTNNLYVGPNNGIGTSFFQGFSPEDLLIINLEPSVYLKIQASKNISEILSLIHKQNVIQEPLVSIDLLAHELKPLANGQHIVNGRIWVDAYGNIKTTLASELFLKLLKEGYTSISILLNGITRSVQFANSFSDIPPGEPFIYVGSSGAVGPNPHRTRRYMELSCNGIQGIFGADLFAKENKRPAHGQEIVFQLTKPDSKQ